MKTNVLYYGENLDILRHHIPDNSIGFICLDTPFNSQATYNVLFREESGAVSHAQIEAFEDTWHWGEATAQACRGAAALSPKPPPRKKKPNRRNFDAQLRTLLRRP